MGIRESLSKIKERITRQKPQNGNGNNKGNGEPRTMTRKEVKEREYSPPKKARVQTTRWKPSKPKPRETPKSGIRGYLERKAQEERLKKERRDTRKHELETIESKAFTKGVEDYYRSKGRSEGYHAAKGRTQKFPILGEPGAYAKRLATNVNANPLLRGILGKQTIMGMPQTKSNKHRPTIKVVIQQGGRVERKRKKRKPQKRDPVRDFIGI